MPSHPLRKEITAWRFRREEYLRASGRQTDLIKEGFEPLPSTASWAVITGGQPTRFAKPNPSAGLLLVKKVPS